MPPFFLFLPMLFWLVILGGGFYLAVRVVRAFEQRHSSRGELEQMRDRLARIEDSFESIGTELQRLNEAQQFTDRLLTERTEEPPE